jgi:hypothetical protein
VVVEEVPWGHGKHQLTNAYMLFLARWARRLSWKETAQAFRTSWDKVFDAVEYVVTYGLQHRTFGPIDAIGVDEIQYAKGHKYLTLVYQIVKRIKHRPPLNLVKRRFKARRFRAWTRPANQMFRLSGQTGK